MQTWIGGEKKSTRVLFSIDKQIEQRRRRAADGQPWAAAEKNKGKEYSLSFVLFLSILKCSAQLRCSQLLESANNRKEILWFKDSAVDALCCFAVVRQQQQQQHRQLKTVCVLIDTKKRSRSSFLVLSGFLYRFCCRRNSERGRAKGAKSKRSYLHSISSSIGSSKTLRTRYNKSK